MHLLRELTHSDAVPLSEIASECPAPFPHISALDLLSRLRSSRADGNSDDLLRNLFALRDSGKDFAESLLVLAFIPTLHGTMRLVARQQFTLSEEDIAQQTLAVLLELLRSPEMRHRRSHYAFAIARGVRRRIFQWARQESMRAAVLDHSSWEGIDFLAGETQFERHTLLRHFLHRSFAKGWLTAAEMNLLIDFKLGGNSSEEFATLNGSSSNAVRQRFKRLLAKLRTLARDAA